MLVIFDAMRLAAWKYFDKTWERNAKDLRTNASVGIRNFSTNGDNVMRIPSLPMLLLDLDKFQLLEKK